MRKTLGNKSAPERLLAVGTVEDIVGHIKEYVNAGVAKFILRPLGRDDAEIYQQTRQLIEQLLPEIETLNNGELR